MVSVYLSFQRAAKRMTGSLHCFLVAYFIAKIGKSHPIFTHLYSWFLREANSSYSFEILAEGQRKIYLFSYKVALGLILDLLKLYGHLVMNFSIASAVHNKNESFNSALKTSRQFHLVSLFFLTIFLNFILIYIIGTYFCSEQNIETKMKQILKRLLKNDVKVKK